MQKSKRLFAALLFAGVCAFTLGAKSPSDSRMEACYALPRTALEIELKVSRTTLLPGKYASYALDLLGIEVPTDTKESVCVESVNILPKKEWDLSKWYKALVNDPSSMAAFQDFCDKGLICGPQCAKGERKPVKGTKTITETVLCPAPVILLDRLPKYSRQQDNVQAIDPLYEEAREAAAKIFELRSVRYAILTGDTDATYSGQALATASDELKKMEDELLREFLATEVRTHTVANYDFVPETKSAQQKEPIFRLSSKSGLGDVKAGDGKMYFIEIIRPEITQPDVDFPMQNAIIYRVPAVCETLITDGQSPIFQGRVPIFQMGAQVRYPIK